MVVADVVAVAGEPVRARAGRGMRWDSRRNELVWVDSEAGLAHRARIGRGGRLHLLCTYHLSGRPGSVTPVAGHDDWLLALDRSIHLLRSDGSTLELVSVAPPGARLHDAACDQRGRLWVGSAPDDKVTPIGGLHRMDCDGDVEVVLDALIMPGGIAWSPDGATMYLVDSGSRRVYSFRFDVDTGTLDARRILLSFEGDEGAPDGIVVDGRGDLWIAMFGGHAIRHHRSDGTPIETVRVPAAQVTSCAFGGRSLRSLYVTTAAEGCDDVQRAADPNAGSLYRIDTDTAGPAVPAFRPDHHWWARAAPAAPPQAAGDGSGYEIVVRGGQGSMLESALPEFEVTQIRGRRVHLVGNVVDQAALHAALHRLHDLHLEVLELHRLSDP